VHLARVVHDLRCSRAGIGKKASTAGQAGRQADRRSE
jgi:hypothetical protein